MNRVPLKPCPFCGSKAHDAGAEVTSISISAVRCSNNDCLASFKSVDAGVWNTRASVRLLNAPEFWLLLRRFAMAPEGIKRDEAKVAVLSAIERATGATVEIAL